MNRNPTLSTTASLELTTIVHQTKVHQVGQPPPPSVQHPELQQRPPLTRIDSRSTFYPPPNQQVRYPGQPVRPGGPAQFIPRAPPNQRPPQPFIQNPANIRNPGVRQIGPYPRPPQGPRFPGAFQQRHPVRATFNAEQRFQKLDSIDSAGGYESEEQRAALVAMKNRSYSVTEEQPKGIEERRYSVSSTGSVDGGKFYPVQGKPDAQLHSSAVAEVKNSEREVNGEGVGNLQVNPSLTDVHNQTKLDNASNDENVRQKDLPHQPKFESIKENSKDEKSVVVQSTQKEEKSAPTLQPEVANGIKPAETKEPEKNVQTPKPKVDEINRNIPDEEKTKEAIRTVRADVVQVTKKDSPGLPKGRNTPDLKIPLKRKSTPKKG